MNTVRTRPGAGWQAHATTPARVLAGANGLRMGPDGALYGVSAFGATVVRVDVDSGAATVLSSPGDAIVSPDDLAFDSRGVLHVAECMDGRVTAWQDGRTWVVADGLIGPNGIDIFEDRIFVDEFRSGGRLLEVFPDGRPPVVLAEGLSGPNGLAVAPDRMVYFSHLLAGEVLRAPIDGGPTEVVLEGLTAPNSVRLGPEGDLYVCVGGAGEVLRLDPRSGRVDSVARARDGIDSIAVARDGRLFLSYYLDGSIVEATGSGEVRELLGGGLLGPYGMASAGGAVYVADGMALSKVSQHGGVSPVTKITDDGFPAFGFLRTIAAAGDALIATLADGRVVRHNPLALTNELLHEGVDEPGGVGVHSDGSVRVVESGSGRVLAIGDRGCTTVADGFARPLDICNTGHDSWLVSDEEAGEVLRVDERGGREVLLGGLDRPQGLAVAGEEVLVAEAGAKRVVSAPLAGGEPSVVADDLPIGLPGGGVRAPMNGLPGVIEGPISPFAALTVDSDGILHAGCDATGCVTMLERAA